MLEAAIEAGADERGERAPEAHEITCARRGFLRGARRARGAVRAARERASWSGGPTTSVTLDEDRAAGVLKLIDALEDNDDVQNVYANFDIPDAVLQRLSA